MALLFAPVLIVLLIFGEDIFSFIFGVEWSQAGRYAAILAPWLFMNFIVSPLSMLPIVLERQKTFFIISLLSHICAISAIIIGHSMFNDNFEMGLILFSGSLTFFSMVSLVWFYSITKSK